MACLTVISSRRLSRSWSLKLNWSLTHDGWKRRLFLLLVLCMSTPHLLTADGARVRHYRWEVSQQYKSPDCFKKLAVVVNGQSPGPTIRAQQGDTVVVEVKNLLHGENTAIHFHGIRQIGTPWSYRIEGVIQCPIFPGETFIYMFVVDRPGTYLYHAHYDMQRSEGLYGSLQVTLRGGVLEPFRYDYDCSIILNDWWHKSATEQSVWLLSIPFGGVNEQQSLLINGRGRFDCSGWTVAAMAVAVSLGWLISLILLLNLRSQEYARRPTPTMDLHNFLLSFAIIFTVIVVGSEVGVAN